MFLANFVLGAVVLALVGVLGYSLNRALRAYLRYRGQRVVTCPETRAPAAVHVASAQAAKQAWLGKTQIRLDQCSRWPERQNCGQDCLSQVQADPERCLVWNMVATWYRGKSCAYCQKPFTEIHWHDRHPAVMSPTHTVSQWNEVPAEKLPEIFETYLPVCWNCYIAESFRQKNADRVLDRGWDRGAGGEFAPKEEAPPVPPKRATQS